MIICFFFICIFILFFEKRKWHSYASPSSLMSIAYLGAAFFAIVGSKFYNFFIITDKAYFVLILSLFVFWLPSNFYKKCHQQRTLIKTNYTSEERLIISGLVVIIILTSVPFIGLNFGDEEWGIKLSRGASGHLLSLLNPIILFCFLYKKILYYHLYYYYLVVYLSLQQELNTI